MWYCRDFCWTDIQLTAIASDGYRFYRNPDNSAYQWLRLHLVVQQKCVGAHMWSQTPPRIFVQLTSFLVEWCIDIRGCLLSIFHDHELNIFLMITIFSFYTQHNMILVSASQYGEPRMASQCLFQIQAFVTKMPAWYNYVHILDEDKATDVKT